MDEQSTEMSVPLDSDGFLRRECSTCEREFKWLASQDGSGEPEPMGGYFCPYCAIQGPGDSWFTKEQIELAQNTVMRQFVDPMLDTFGQDLRRSSRGGFVKFDMQHRSTAPLDPLVEADDMRRVGFQCHPAEPVKVLDEWDREVHCLICGTPAAQRRA